MLIRFISVRSRIPSVPKEYKMGTKGRGIQVPPSCPGVLHWEQTENKREWTGTDATTSPWLTFAELKLDAVSNPLISRNFLTELDYIFSWRMT